VDNYM